MSTKVIITGAAGFLGSHLLEKLGDRYDIIGLSSSLTKPKGNLMPFDTEDLSPEVVIHAHAAVASGGQALDDKTLFDGNVQATRSIVDRFPKAKHLYFSTVSVYAPTDSIINESTTPNPPTDYGMSKLDGEGEVAKAHKYCIIRLSSLCGPRMKQHTLVPNYVNQALDNGFVNVWGDGSRLQNYIYVDDVIQLVQSIIEKNQFCGQIYLGTSNRSYSNLEIAHAIAKITGAEIRFVNQDNSKSWSYDNSFTTKSLNWKPQHFIESGIPNYIHWLKSQKA